MIERRQNSATATRAYRFFNAPVIGVSAVVLLLGTLVYLLDRTVGSVPLFADISLADRLPLHLGALSLSFPSFAHTFAFAAITSTLMRRRRDVALSCLAWLTVEIAFEIGQLPKLASAFATLVPPTYESLPFLNETVRYFANGTFDPWDLLSAAVGSICAYVFVTWFPQRSAFGVK